MRTFHGTKRTHTMVLPVLVLAAAAGTYAQAVPVDLKGKVTAASGAAVAGAEVTLMGRGLKDSTDAGGAYAILAGPTSLFRGAKAPSARETSAHSALWRTGHPRIAGSNAQGPLVEWFRLDGRKQPQYHAPVAKSEAMGHLGAEGPLAKQGAVIDSFKVTAAGYATAYKSIESYQGEVNIVLQPVTTAECNPADRTPAPTPVNTTFSGAAFTGPHQVVVETDPGMPGVTIFRPKELGVGKGYPIAAWGQGGCSKNGLSNREFQAEIASHGYVVFSDGAPNGSGSGSMTNDIVGMGKPLVDYIKFAIKENNRPCSPYYRSLDTAKTAAFGWSCGGLMAEGAAASNLAALTTFMVLNSGMTSLNQSVINAFKTPMLVVVGGTGDQAYPNGTRDYEAVQTLPAVWMSSDVGHGGTYSQDNGGAYAQVCVNWMNWWLKGDTGPKGKGYFVGAGCGLCSNTAWTIKSKNIP